MIFSVIVNNAPQQGQSAWSAYRFTEAVLASGHTIYRVFFYMDGVWNGARDIRPAQDESNLGSLWTKLAERNEIDLVVCISAARRRGIFDQPEAQRESVAANLRSGFQLSGLGQYSEALLVSDRTVSFGGK